MQKIYQTFGTASIERSIAWYPYEDHVVRAFTTIEMQSTVNKQAADALRTYEHTCCRGHV